MVIMSQIPAVRKMLDQRKILDRASPPPLSFRASSRTATVADVGGGGGCGGGDSSHHHASPDAQRWQARPDPTTCDGTPSLSMEAERRFVSYFSRIFQRKEL